MTDRPSRRRVLTFAAALLASAAAGVLLGLAFPVVPLAILVVGAYREDGGLIHGAVAGFLVGAGTCLSTLGGLIGTP